MGHRLISFDFVPDKNEQIEAVIKVPQEPRSVIHGIVKNHKNQVVKDAVVKLFKAKGCDPCDLEPITHAFTDECGQFLFGPLPPKQKYVIKVWIGDVKIRQIIIRPDKCEGCNDEKNVHDCNCESDFEEDEI
ncbi:MAG: carboxypeptidase-like regulatory domain-containing protein [Maledivibacter sp.]|nr:carboxypeptidase-like regulatory domain-containing protein [Maledivibacter sp.]